MKFNMYRCRHIEQKVTTTYYPNPNPNHKKNIKCGPKNLKHNPTAGILLKKTVNCGCRIMVRVSSLTLTLTATSHRNLLFFTHSHRPVECIGIVK